MSHSVAVAEAGRASLSPVLSCMQHMKHFGPAPGHLACSQKSTLQDASAQGMFLQDSLIMPEQTHLQAVNYQSGGFPEVLRSSACLDGSQAFARQGCVVSMQTAMQPKVVSSRSQKLSLSL